jgi:hypothetical protein
MNFLLQDVSKSTRCSVTGGSSSANIKRNPLVGLNVRGGVRAERRLACHRRSHELANRQCSMQRSISLRSTCEYLIATWKQRPTDFLFVVD